MAGYRGALEAAQHRIAALEDELRVLRAAAESGASPSQRLKRENTSLKARLQKTRSRLKEARSNFRSTVAEAVKKQEFIRANKARRLAAENMRLRKALRVTSERCAELERRHAAGDGPPSKQFGRRKPKGPKLTAVDAEDASVWDRVRRFLQT